MKLKKLCVYLDNYTKWRRDNLFEDMTADELLNASAEYAKMRRPIFEKLAAN